MTNRNFFILLPKQYFLNTITLFILPDINLPLTSATFIHQIDKSIPFLGSPATTTKKVFPPGPNLSFPGVNSDPEETNLLLRSGC